MTGERSAADVQGDSTGLTALLEHLERGVDAAAAALSQETAAIGSGDSQALLAAVASKRSALRDLETLARDPRLPTLLSAAHSPWKERSAVLVSRLRDCEQGNLANGRVLVGARRDNALLLRMLGHSPEAPVYGTRGDADPAMPSRSLGTA